MVKQEKIARRDGEAFYKLGRELRDSLHVFVPYLFLNLLYTILFETFLRVYIVFGASCLLLLLADGACFVILGTSISNRYNVIIVAYFR